MFWGARVAVFVSAVCTIYAAEPWAARWEGSVQLPGREIPLVIDLAQDATGHWAGSAIVPGRSAKGVPLTQISVSGAAIEFGIKGALGEPKLQGSLAADSVSGTFRQAGNSAPFTLHRAGPPQVELPPQSSALKPAVVGDWQGEMVLGTRKIRVTLKLTNEASGSGSALFHFSGTRETDLPADLVTQDSTTLTITAAGGAILYEARIQPDNGEITGVFSQGPVDAPLALHRAAKGKA